MSKTSHRGFAHLRLAMLALCVAGLFLAIPSSSAASPGGGPQCMIEPWYCDPRGGSGNGPEQPCMIEPWECGPEEPGPKPGSCIPGRYIVVFWSWVEDPEALARAQVEKYGGELGFIYKSALKGYSAGYSKAAIEAVREEPSVKYAEVDRVVGLFGASSASSPAGDECEPEQPGPLPPEGEPPCMIPEGCPGDGPDDPICMIPEGCPEGGMPSSGPPPGDGPICMIPEGCGPIGDPPPGVAQCGKGAVRKGKRCVRKRPSFRRACLKRPGIPPRRCMRRG